MAWGMDTAVGPDMFHCVNAVLMCFEGRAGSGGSSSSMSSSNGTSSKK